MSDDMRAVAYELSNSDGETIIIRSERHQVESYKHIYSTDLVNELVRQTDALAKLAEKDAEIARLRDALRGIIDTAHNPSKTVWVRIEEVQKEAENAIRNLGAAP